MQLATGMMDSTDINAVITLAKMVPSGGVIVDVGSLLGMSASLWCMHSAASRIVCIDLWKFEPWLDSFAKNNGGEISKQVFLNNVPDGRIEAIQGSSPSCVSSWWCTPVDLYWDDADHTNPGLARNLRFWSRQVKNGGIICGHDYHWPDVAREANALAAKWRSTLDHLGTSVWFIRKPERYVERKVGLTTRFAEYVADQRSEMSKVVRGVSHKLRSGIKRRLVSQNENSPQRQPGLTRDEAKADD